jgi:hypothetical protein
MKPTTIFLNLFISLLLYNCSGKAGSKKIIAEQHSRSDSLVKPKNKTGVRTVHVFVALCDNKYQGIVPVGKIIGNGQDPDNNLYWGCDNGLRTYFKKKSSDWLLVKTEKQLSDTILERLLFKHRTEDVYLLADAYDGRYIKQTTIDFLQAASGSKEQTILYNGDTLVFGGASDLVAYIGHDGLMDFTLPVGSPVTSGVGKDAIILACYSQYYFQPHLRNTAAFPLLWTTNLMAPEAYTLHDALSMWVNGKNRELVRTAAAKAYSKFQNCSVRAAENLLVSGWK